MTRCRVPLKFSEHKNKFPVSNSSTILLFFHAQFCHKPMSWYLSLQLNYNSNATMFILISAKTFLIFVVDLFAVPIWRLRVRNLKWKICHLYRSAFCKWICSSSLRFKVHDWQNENTYLLLRVIGNRNWCNLNNLNYISMKLSIRSHGEFLWRAGYIISFRWVTFRLRI